MNTPSGSLDPLVCALSTAAAAVARAAVSPAAPPKLPARSWASAWAIPFLDIGDGRRQHPDGPPDVAFGAANRVQQRVRLSQRRLRSPYAVEDLGLLAGDWVRRQLTGSGNALVGKDHSVLCGRDVPGHRNQSGAVELAVQVGELLLHRRNPRRQLHELLRQLVQHGGRIDDQIAQFAERFGLCVQLTVGLRGGQDEVSR